MTDQKHTAGAMAAAKKIVKEYNVGPSGDKFQHSSLELAIADIIAEETRIGELIQKARVLAYACSANRDDYPDEQLYLMVTRAYKDVEALLARIDEANNE